MGVRGVRWEVVVRVVGLGLRCSVRVGVWAELRVEVWVGAAGIAWVSD